MGVRRRRAALSVPRAPPPRALSWGPMAPQSVRPGGPAQEALVRETSAREVTARHRRSGRFLFLVSPDVVLGETKGVSSL